MAACVAGDDAAWTELVETWRPLVVTVARQVLARGGAEDPRALAEDVASDVFLELLAHERRALTRFQAPFSLPGWLTVVARRRARKVLRKGAPTPPGPLPVTPRGSIGSDVGRVEEEALVRDEVGRLPARDRDALQLFYERGGTYADVGRALGVPAERVGTLLARARARLARSLGFLSPSA